MDYDQKKELLLKKIILQTEQQKLIWKADADDSSFSAVLGPKYVVRTSWPKDVAYVRILDSESREIFVWRETEQEPAKGVMPIWLAAKRSALGLDKALDELLTELG